VFKAIASFSLLLGRLRWLFMPLGLFALVAVGIHAGASVVSDWLLVALDWADGLCDRAMTEALLSLGRWLSLDPTRVDHWIFQACAFVDLRERGLLASWLAVGLELWADFVLALPVLGYREKDVAAAASSKEARLRELLAARGFSNARPDSMGLRDLLRESVRDPTVWRALLPVATLAVVLAGCCKVAVEVQASSFALAAKVLPAATAGDIGRFVGIFVLGGAFVSLGLRSVLQSAFSAHLRAQPNREKGGARRRFKGWLRLASAMPLAVGAALAGTPVLSFFR